MQAMIVLSTQDEDFKRNMEGGGVDLGFDNIKKKKNQLQARVVQIIYICGNTNCDCTSSR